MRDLAIDLSPWMWLMLSMLFRMSIRVFRGMSSAGCRLLSKAKTSTGQPLRCV